MTDSGSMGMISRMLLSHPTYLKSIEAREKLRRGIKVVSFTYPGKDTVEFAKTLASQTLPPW